MDVCFIIGNNIDLAKYDFNNKIVVGVDRGAYLAYLANIKLDYAIGDFDSISRDELEVLSSYTKVVKLNPIKDDTDTLYALKMFAQYERLIILGGITGKRIDHFVANLKLFYEFPKLVMVDDNTIIKLCDKESNFQKDEYNFYSFFALEDVDDLSLKGFKYEVNQVHLSHTSNIGVSNEIVADNAFLSYSKGKLLLIKTKE